MTFRQFAFRNVTRNKRLYAAYFLSSLFTVMVFFTFAVFAYHPVIGGKDMHRSAATALSASKWVIYVFSFFFVLYSMSVFLQSRKREFGLLMMQGMSTVQLRKMIFLENMMIGFMSILGGIGLGLVFAKGILLAGENVLRIEEELSFYFPLRAIGLTLLVFLVLFVLISLFISSVLRSRKLITLIKADRQSKGEPKASFLLSVLVVVLLGVSYFLALKAQGTAALALLLPIIGMVSLGTYLLFTQFSVFVLRLLKRRESFFWKKTNMLLFSDLTFRMKDNARTFFLVAIISTVSFCAIGALYGFKTIITEGVAEKNPYLFTYLAMDQDKAEQSHVQDIERTLEKHGLNTRQGTLRLDNFSTAGTGEKLKVVRESDYNTLAALMGVDEVQLKADKAAVVDFGVSREGERMLNLPVHLVNGAVLEADQAILSPAIHGVSSYFVVDDDSYAKLGTPDNTYHYYAWHGAAGQSGAEQAGAELINHLPYSEQYEFYPLDYRNVQLEKGFAPAMFVGLFIGIVFFVSAGSFLYFRLYSDLDEDKQKFKSISKIGLSDKELTRILNRQIMLLFFAPIVVALIHGAVALTTLSNMFHYSLFKESLLVLGVFTLIQFLYFFIVRFFYIKQVKSALP
ncbi:FtsX-like permease family protein [Paenibacillus donghaensis]|uniref:ABC transporter permease n=1 Tax=Paenibacillus donghaensis TaxID=414771 RepID=A0A2Z2KFY4_9BACL|nr:ABC transporter permease [Paenibacillus donghaensis]ASA24727.1 ABC transporter permease [Paenibacillus donghaensis]